MITVRIKLNWFCESFMLCMGLEHKVKSLPLPNQHFLSIASLNLWS